MADTWPVNEGSVGTQSSTEVGYGAGQVDPGLAKAAGIGSQAPQAESLDAFGGEGATVIQGVGIDETPGANSATATDPSTEEQTQTESPPPVTRSGTPPATVFLPSRTAIQDRTGQNALLSPDTFLQGLQGGLSSILNGALSNLIAGLPPIMQDFLSATGLTGALSGMVNQLSAGLSQALGSLSQGLAGAVGHIAGEIGNALTSIPGVGPVLEELGNAAKGIVSSLQEGFNSLTPELQAITSDAIGAVGASALRAPNLRGVISDITANNILGQMRFTQNPADGLNRLASASTAADGVFFAQTGNAAFADLAARARTAETEFRRVLQPVGERLGFTPNVNRAQPALIEAAGNIRRVTNGAIQIG